MSRQRQRPERRAHATRDPRPLSVFNFSYRPSTTSHGRHADTVASWLGSSRDPLMAHGAWWSSPVVFVYTTCHVLFTSSHLWPLSANGEKSRSATPTATPGPRGSRKARARARGHQARRAARLATLPAALVRCPAPPPPRPAAALASTRSQPVTSGTLSSLPGARAPAVRAHPPP